MNKLEIFKKRLQKLGIEINLVGNFPWIYIDTINNIKVKELFYANHGFTIAFLPIRPFQEINFTNITEIFKLIRKYIKLTKMKTETLFFHGTTTDNQRFTIAGEFISTDISDFLNLGISLCGRKEQFSRKLGRVKAEGRMMGNGYKGSLKISLYSFDDFNFINEDELFDQDWFIGREVQIFVKYCSKFEFFNAKQLKSYFFLHN